MILHHVTQRPGAFIISGASFDAECFGGGNLHVIDIPCVPKRFENRVGEAQHQNVLRRLLSEEVVNAVRLLFGERVADDAI